MLNSTVSMIFFNTKFKEATLAALRQAKEDTKLEITLEMLKTAKNLVKPSAGDQRKFFEWNKKFGTY